MGWRKDAVLRARHTCASYSGHDEAVQLNATDRLAISCEPPEGSARNPAPPCIHEPFFHFARGFERMTAAELEQSSDRKRNGIDPFVQCRIRRVGHDEDWPTVDPDLTRTDATKTMVDVMGLLGKRRVTMIGASLVRQSLGAMQCQLESASLRRSHELQWRHWGWSTFSQDNKGCAGERHAGLWRAQGRAKFEGLRAAGCVPRGDEFVRAVLNQTDVVILAYNPQHYEGSLEWWRYDLSLMLPLLAAFARQPGKLVLLREPPAQHFAGGSFVKASAGFVSPTRGCCAPLSPHDAYHNFNFDAVLIAHELVGTLGGGRVRILPWYNATLRRWNAHVATRAACFTRATDPAADSGTWVRRASCFCDCTHLCYSPLFYDDTMLTPLHLMLYKQARRERRAAARSAAAVQLQARRYLQ